MKFVENFEIETTKNLAESLNELRTVTNKNYFTFFGLYEKTMFRGKISKTNFKITKIANARGISETVSIGNISQKEGITIIEISIRPSIYSVVSYLIMIAFILFFSNIFKCNRIIKCYNELNIILFCLSVYNNSSFLL